VNEREQALAILESYERKGIVAGDSTVGDAGDLRDANFVRTIVHGVLRWRPRLDYVIERLAKRPVASIDEPVRQILRIGLYQVGWMNVPPHAAVSETVDLAARRAPRAKSFVNAVLRRATERDVAAIVPAGSSTAAAAVRSGHPGWLLERWERAYGVERGRSIATANQELSYPDLLVNTARRSPAEVVEIVARRGGEATVSPLVGGVVRLKGPASRLREEIERGEVYPMDEGSIAVVRCLPSDARSVLDIAAAPGGKSLALVLEGRSVVSHDVSIERLLPLRRASQRLAGRDARIVAGDGRRPPFRASFDAVLLDAPCSATGTIRKNQGVKWRLTEPAIRRYAELQRELLRSALAISARYCVYSTCSLEPEENDAVVGAVAGPAGFERGDLATVVDPSLRPWVEGGVLRLTPESGAEGFTVTLLVRR
jgi:16S rRNA (cytosine967-C5)-methyltransferase